MKEHLFPIRHGNWHVIGGKLVDVKGVEKSSAEPSQAAEAGGRDDSGSHPAHGMRHPLHKRNK